MKNKIPKLGPSSKRKLTEPTLSQPAKGLRKNQRESIEMVLIYPTQKWMRKKVKKEETKALRLLELVTLDLPTTKVRTAEVEKAKKTLKTIQVSQEERWKEVTEPISKSPIPNGAKNGMANRMMATMLRTPKQPKVMDSHPVVTTPKTWVDTRPSEPRDKVTPTLVLRKTTPRHAPTESCSLLSLHKRTLHLRLAVAVAFHPFKLPSVTQSCGNL